MDLIGLIEFVFIMALLLVGPFIWVKIRGEKYGDPEDGYRGWELDDPSSPHYRAADLTREELIHPDFQYYREFLDRERKKKEASRGRTRGADAAN